MCSFTLGIIIDFEYKQNILQKYKTSTWIKSPIFRTGIDYGASLSHVTTNKKRIKTQTKYTKKFRIAIVQGRKQHDRFR